jgi:hypothetical protein
MIEKYICIGSKYGFIIGNIYNIKTHRMINSYNKVINVIYLIYQDHLLPIAISKNDLCEIFIPLSEWRNQQIDKILNDENLN